MDLRDIQAGAPGALSALARAGLRVLSWGWGAGAGLRRVAYALGLRRRVRAAVPVLCVGNLTAGGTGKTPAVVWLARRLLAAGRRPGILARGYGARAADGSGLNDEGAVIRGALGRAVPQVQDRDRVRGARTLLAQHPEVDVLVLDDGFQHWRLARDLDLVLVDATRPFGHGHLIPRGLLRERPRALGRAGAVLVTRAERVGAERLSALRARLATLTTAPVAVARTVPTGTVPDLRGRAVFACCGIGNPRAFLGTLADLGAKVVGQRVLADHGVLPAGGWTAVVAEARRAGAQAVVTTRKDAVKYARLPPEVAVLDVELEIVAGESALWAAIARAAAGEGAPAGDGAS